MNAQTAFAQRLFAILNGKPIEEMKRLDAAPVPPPEDSKWHEDVFSDECPWTDNG